MGRILRNRQLQDASPASMIIMAITYANMGRSIKKLGMS